MLFNINTLEWDDEILEELGIQNACCHRQDHQQVYGMSDLHLTLAARFQLQGSGDQLGQLYLDRHVLLR